MYIYTGWDGVTASSVTACSVSARRINARRISIVGQAVVVSVLGDQGYAGDALAVCTNNAEHSKRLPRAVQATRLLLRPHSLTRDDSAHSPTKITQKSCQQRAKTKPKSTQEPSKIDVGCVLGGFKRSTSL